MTMETIIKSVLEQSIIGALFIIFMFMFKNMVNRLFDLVKNNTVAMTKTSEAVKDMKNYCSTKHDG